MKPLYKVVEHPTEWDITVYKTVGVRTHMAKVYVVRKPNDVNYWHKPSYKVVSKADVLQSAVKLPKRFDDLIRAWVQMRGET